MKKRNIIIIIITIILIITGILILNKTDSEILLRPRRTPRPTPTRVIKTSTPVITKTPTSTAIPTFTSTPTKTLAPTFTNTPTSTSTNTPTQTTVVTEVPTSTPDGVIAMPLSPVPVTGVDDIPALTEQLFPSDVILIRSTSAKYFIGFTNQPDARALMFTINEDGYPTSLSTSIAAILDIADQYGVTVLAYNLEWPQHSLQEKVDRLAAVRAELDRQGNTRPIVFGPTFYDFWASYAAFAPYIDGYAIQLQRATIGTEVDLAEQSIAKANSVLENPIIYIQISCQASGQFMRTAEQVIEVVNGLSELEGVSYVNLYFTEWWLAEEVINYFRP